MKNQKLKDLRLLMRTHPSLKPSRDYLAAALRKHTAHDNRRYVYRKLVRGTFTMLSDDYNQIIPDGRIPFNVATCRYNLIPDYAALLGFENRLSKLKKERFKNV